MINFFKEISQPIINKAVYALNNIFTRLGVNPNVITTIGFFINVVATVVFIVGGSEPRTDLRYVGWGGAIILIGGLFDMIDGRLARMGKMESKFGALYDSVLDRYSELAMFLGICYYLIAQSYFLSSLFAFIAMIGSIMVSYVRARAESLGIECNGGLMQRPERILLLGISAVLCGLLADYTGQFKYTVPGTTFPIFENITIFTFPIFILAILTNWTAIQRLRESKAALDKLDSNLLFFTPKKTTLTLKTQVLDKLDNDLLSFTKKGIDVFGNEEKFNIWMNSRLPSLEGKSPKDLLSSTSGIQLLMDELGRIEHGVLA